jgi:hypothetical protein
VKGWRGWGKFGSVKALGCTIGVVWVGSLVCLAFTAEKMGV